MCIAKYVGSGALPPVRVRWSCMRGACASAKAPTPSIADEEVDQLEHLRLVKLPCLAAAHAAPHRPRSPATCSGLSLGPRGAPSPRGCRKEAAKVPLTEVADLGASRRISARLAGQATL